MQGIYSITNSMNDKVYIGQDSNIPNRWNYHHKRELAKGIHENKHLQASYNKYGINAFQFDILVCGPFDKEDLTELEQFYLDKYKTEGKILYNLLPANNSRVGIKTSDETKRKLSEIGKGRIISEETKKKLRKSLIGNKNSLHKQNALGYKHTSEELKQISEASKGNKHALGHKQSAYAKQVASEIHKGKTISEEQKQNHSLFMKQFWINKRSK